MNIVNIESKEQLNNFSSQLRHSQFLQSWQWGEFHNVVSDKVIRLGVEDGKKLIAATTLIKKTLPMGKNYFYCPRGPVAEEDKWSKEVQDLLFNEINSLAQAEGVMFMRFDPNFEIKGLNFKIKETLDIQPPKTQILVLAKKESELLSNMHQKTRYNIKLADKKGVKVSQTDIKDFETFWQQISETSDRDNFRLHGRDYYEAMFKLDPSFIKVYKAEYRKKILTMMVATFFGDTVTYVHGCSSNENRNVMAPYLLQWHVIKEAKKEGFRYYDFYGVDDKKWPGVTRFKSGFGGRNVNYPGTFDLIFDDGWYQVYKMVRKVRRTF